MYQEYFGLSGKPFAETPNPKFFYLSAKHREGLAHLEYNILDGKGFTVLVGEVGTGKTTLSRALIERLDPEKVTIAQIIHTNLDFHEFLREVVEELGIFSPGQEKWDLLKALNQYLIEAYGQNRKVVLIVDEAQNLSPEVLEGIRMLSNLETPQEKLIQIVFVGQPGLLENIQKPEMLQLKQRIAGNYYLESLTLEETKEYIQFRLKCVQAKPSLRFEPEALDLIYQISKGIPRLINFLCDFCLIKAFVAETWTIDPSIVRKAYQELSGSLESGNEEEKKVKRFQDIQRGLRKVACPQVSTKNALVPEGNDFDHDMEEGPADSDKEFALPSRRPFFKKWAVTFGLAILIGGIGSFVFWNLNQLNWTYAKNYSEYRIKIPLSDSKGELPAASPMSDKKLSKMTYNPGE